MNSVKMLLMLNNVKMLIMNSIIMNSIVTSLQCCMLIRNDDQIFRVGRYTSVVHRN